MAFKREKVKLWGVCLSIYTYIHSLKVTLQNTAVIAAVARRTPGEDLTCGTWSQRLASYTNTVLKESRQACGERARGKEEGLKGEGYGEGMNEGNRAF